MKSLLQKLTHQVSNTVRSIDRFGIPINLTYNKNNKFKTHFGGVWSLLMHALFVFYMIFLLVNLVEKKTANVSMSNTVRDVVSDKTEHYFAKDDFVLSMGILNQNHSLLGDYMKQYFDLIVYQGRMVIDENGETQWETRPLELETWEERYPVRNNAALKYYHNDKFVWVKDDDYYLKSNWYADDTTLLSIELRKWNSTLSPNCKSDEEINEFVKDKYYEILMVDRYFDAQNYTQPVGKTMTDNFYYTIHPEMTKQTQVYVKENKLELMDSFFQYGETEKSTFYSISGGFEDYKIFDGNIFVVTYFVLDREVATHRRTIYSFFDMLAQLGGVFHLLYSFLNVFLYYYSEKMLQYSILRKCYQFSSDAADKMPVFNKREIHQNSKDSTPMPKLSLARAFSTIVNNNKPVIDSGTPIWNNVADKLATGPNLTQNQANDLAAIMKQRRRFDFSSLDFIYGILCPIKLFWWCCK